MKELAHLADHTQQLLFTLTTEQASAIVSSCCAVGGLLLQYLNYRRGNKEQ